MYVIIVGCGRMGSELAFMLSDEGHDVVLVDSNPHSFKRLGHAFNGMTIEGNGYNCEVLEEAGIKEAHGLAAVTNEDNTNIIAVQVARQIYKVPVAVARVYDPHKAATYNQLGLEIINTTSVISRMFRDRFIEGQIERYLKPYQEKVAIYNIEVKDKLIGRSVMEFNHPEVFTIVTITAKGRMVLPAREYKLIEGDVLLGVGAVDKKEEIYTLLWGDKTP